MYKQNKNGQIVLGLILVMVVALGIGLSIVQKSLVDVSTATKIEQSSRSFSAAEAGIEKALRGGTCGAGCVNFPDSKANVIDTGLLPAIPPPFTSQTASEYPALSKEEVAHAWLADYSSATNPPPPFYKLNSLIVYWGSPSSAVNDMPALEIKVVIYNVTAGYTVIPFYLDADSLRAAKNKFTDASANCNKPSITTTFGPNRQFLCSSTLSGWASTDTLMLVRARFLYSANSQPFAVKSPSTCADVAAGCYLPPQARILVSTGISGETQRRVMLYQENKVIPFYFDYAIFSAGEVVKR